jgi:hypothetical protein
VKETSSFEEHIQEITRYHDFGEVGNNRVAQAHARLGTTNATDKMVHEDLRTLLAAYNGGDYRRPRDLLHLPHAPSKLPKDLSPETMEKFMQLQQTQRPQNTRPTSTITTTNTPESSTGTTQPILSTNGLPRQYGTTGNARLNLTETVSGTDVQHDEDDVSDSSTVPSNELGISTDGLNTLVEFRNIMAAIS